MYASPFETLSSSHGPEPSQQHQHKIDIDDIIHALKAAKTAATAARQALAEERKRASNRKQDLIDLWKSDEAFVIAQKVFSTGKVYQPVSLPFRELKDAKRELAWQLKQSHSSSVLDPSTVTYEILKIKIAGPVIVQAEDDESATVPDLGVILRNVENVRNVSSVPIGADTIDGIPEDEIRDDFEKSFSHFDDDVGEKDPNEDAATDAHEATASAPETQGLDLDRWFKKSSE